MRAPIDNHELEDHLFKLSDHGTIVAYSVWVICMILLRIEAAIVDLKRK